MGVEAPLPGNATFQATWSAVHFTGGLPVLVLPVPLGPRQPGQFEAVAVSAALAIIALAHRVDSKRADLKFPVTSGRRLIILGR